jgi:DNA-binding NarL/FixJ family response regulator
VERPVRVLLASPHRLVREGLRVVLAAGPGLEVIGEADDEATALVAASEGSPHVAIVDADLPRGGASTLVRRLHGPPYEVPCIVLDRRPDDEVVLRSVVAGAAGYLAEDADPATLRSTVEIVAAGGSSIDGPTLTELRERASNGPGPDPMVVGRSAAGRH